MLFRSNLQELMLQVRMQVKDYMITHSDTDMQEYKEYMGKLQAILDEAKGRIKNPERAAKIATIDKDADTYQTAFEQLIADIRESDRIINEVLRFLGPSMQNGMNEIMASAKNDQDFDTTTRAALATQHMLLARLYAQKFLATVSEKDAELVVAENGKMQEILGQIAAGAQDRKSVV